MGPEREVLVRIRVVRLPKDAMSGSGNVHVHPGPGPANGLFSRERVVRDVRPWKKSAGMEVNFWPPRYAEIRLERPLKDGSGI
mgnify:CR=1 FL=1